jgi:hypothetical protein
VNELNKWAKTDRKGIYNLDNRVLNFATVDSPPSSARHFFYINSSYFIILFCLIHLSVITASLLLVRRACGKGFFRSREVCSIWVLSTIWFKYHLPAAHVQISCGNPCRMEDMAERLQHFAIFVFKRAILSCN